MSVGILLLASPVLSQTNPDVNQALLNEIRQLRQDLQVVAVTIQRIHIVMYRLQVQADSLNRSLGRRDNAQDECRQLEQHRKGMTGRVEQMETMLRSSLTPAQRAETQQEVVNLKSAIESMGTEERECQAKLIEAESGYRTEQAKMEGLQDQLQKLETLLAGFAPRQ
jgi:chromosome segregation ATPase